ncbi:uncharacterized protein NMK_2118 [Novimethylophilus kurashikiensis]|uniref:Uncharacterized protein n=1 Tax=Novimethylophilus kurashikiensis TaxID=1825523 RepID=A0A2R5F9M7_9PROT|nr:hypothetical protein [Novimethylophilus kurashikiensis]GBG14519.1 uncharacterized protein NMK_2118 [Novimethylophilus kurashikiensis]
MWIFLFILAIVPMTYYWSDSVVTLFPQLSQYFPDKGSNKQGVAGQAPGQDKQPLLPTKWAEAKTEAGYAVWLMSADGQYRVAVGCRTGEAPAIRITQLNGQPIPSRMMLDFQFGRIPLLDGVFAGATPDLLNAVSQFSAMSLQYPQTPEQVKANQPGLAAAWFKVDQHESGLVARGLQQNCGFRN